MERRSYECYLSGLLDEAITASETALELWRETGDLLKQGDRLRWLSRLHWFAGHNAEAEQAGLQAITTIESLPPGPELARAYSNQAQLRTVARDTAEALLWGERAIDLAERLGETETLVHALNNVGTARLYIDDESGLVLLERSLALARQNGYEDHVARALANLAWSMILRYRFAEAEQYLAEGMTYSIEHDLDIMRNYLQADWSVLHLRRGQWAAALEAASEAVHDAASNVLTRILAWTVIGLVRVRRGEDATEALDEALALAERNGDIVRHFPVRAARAEAAWLTATLRVVAEARTVLDEALRRHHRWLAGDLTLTLVRAGECDLSGAGLAQPYALQLQGEWQRASEIWHTLGCPLEEARALVDGDEEAVRQAWTIFDRLGARFDAAIAIRRLRDLAFGSCLAVPAPLPAAIRPA